MKIVIIGSLIAFVLFVAGALVSQTEKGQQTPADAIPNKLTPVDSITHAHGLAVDVEDPNKLYIATHHGLLLLKDEKDLFRVGTSEDDFMGFTPHPTKPNVFFSSGHPSTGGNLGILKSEDGGQTWQKLSDGVNGPVDFHAMTISPVNPSVLYGWYNGALQRSDDGGNNWEIVTRNIPNVITLASDPKDENTVYAATVQGLMQSNNKGKDWENVSDDLKETVVAALAINPQDSQKMVSYTEKLGLARSNDGGSTWEKVSEQFGGETVLHIAFNKQNPEIVYALTQNNALYKSTDGGTTWNKIR